ncbi:hypothetical protein EDC01DRAFT_631752 [Geopyxis carbonaria]|nr:hypothetical protein EDC01DRAFT_631752 [Geopyxis carbonaria]
MHTSPSPPSLLLSLLLLRHYLPPPHDRWIPTQNWVRTIFPGPQSPVFLGPSMSHSQRICPTYRPVTDDASAWPAGPHTTVDPPHPVCYQPSTGRWKHPIHRVAAPAENPSPRKDYNEDVTLATCISCRKEFCQIYKERIFSIGFFRCLVAAVPERHCVCGYWLQSHHLGSATSSLDGIPVRPHPL